MSWFPVLIWLVCRLWQPVRILPGSLPASVMSPSEFVVSGQAGRGRPAPSRGTAPPGRYLLNIESCHLVGKSDPGPEINS